MSSLSHKHFAIPKSNVQRPKLPVECANPHIKQLDQSKPPPVKFQEIVRDGQATVVGRIKIPTPGGHAFILRRLDTGAISLTTMFRAAFPSATEDAEKAEANWVKMTFDVAGANKSGKARFAGTWVNPEVAVSLAEQYHLGFIIPSLADASPDPNVVYRRSSKGQQPTPNGSPAASPKEPGPNPPKRRREASPALSTTSTVVHPSPPVVPSAPALTPGSAEVFTSAPVAAQVSLTAAATTLFTESSSPVSSRIPTSPPPRRSARIKSAEPPSSIPVPVFAVPPKTPKTRKAPKEQALTPAGSDETAVDEDIAAKIAEPNMEEDVREQKELIAKLKAEREAAQRAKAEAKEVAEEEAAVYEEQGMVQKRAREDDAEGYRFNFKEPEVETRVIATNRRRGWVLSRFSRTFKACCSDQILEFILNMT
ncbi:hypothetical protein A0H81_07590 [Grifola frondosa]|uniref:HTH APSES-type domain-containing protein n=1 Tax=Grifola frondosa TaxID=5627 RepID=A0A1C7M6V0_GRIFR|nr:hypothetical protein A0H81_07590 [Grifola frondosa]